MKTYRLYNPVSLTPAEGWRAAYIHEPSEGEPGWSAQPLIGWGIFRVTKHPVKGGVGPAVDEGNEIHGVAIEDASAFCVAEVGNLWRYLAPGEADPTDEEVAAERARRR